MGHPVWRYRKGPRGRIEGAIFDSDQLGKLTKGWKDTPAELTEMTWPYPVHKVDPKDFLEESNGDGE
jgi:hypothetical protein